MPDLFRLRRGRRRLCSGGRSRGARAPRACLRGGGLTHLHAQSGAQTGLHCCARGALAAQCLCRLELRELVQIPDHPHRRPFVHHLLHGGGERDVFDIKFGDGQPVFCNGGRDFGAHQFAQLTGIGGHIHDRNIGQRDAAREFLHDDIADLIADLVHGEFTIGAHDFGQEPRGVRHFDRVGAI